jgi:pimeloyl-ACP methyl ester carboxylesterase
MPEPVVSAAANRPAAPRVYYLHGFASSAGSTKAGYFAERLRIHGVPLHCPDFNAPDFKTLTMTRMLAQLESELCGRTILPGLPGLPGGEGTPATPGIEDGPVTLVGSSLGGTLAILAAARMPQIDRVVLLAPAVMFAKPGHHLLPAERIEAWRRDGSMTFFHYGYGEERPLSVQFYEDSLHYDSFAAQFAQPTLIFQGRRDASVDCRTVEQFASGRPNVTLTLLDDDHSLVDSLPHIWRDVAPFLGFK